MTDILKGRRTLTGDLTLVLSLLVVLVVGTVGAFNYRTMASSSRQELIRVAGQISDHLADMLVVPLWNYDEAAVRHVAESALRSEDIRAVLLQDRDGAILFKRNARLIGKEGDPRLTFTRDIFHKGFKVGSLSLLYSDSPLERMREQAILFVVLTIFFLVAAIWIVNVVVLSRLLKGPLARMSQGINKLARGEYGARLPPVPQRDLDEIFVGVNRMAAAIEDRDRSLRTEIQARIRANEGLAESEERYEAVLMAHPDPVVIYDPQGRVQFVNQEFTRVFGYGLDRFLGKRMKNFVAPEHDAEARALFDRILAGEVLSGVEGVRRTLDGRTVPVSMSGAAYADHEGRSLGVIVNVRDVSRAKEMENRLAQAQKMEAVGTLAGGVAHDVNNLLMGIQGYASLMLLDIEPGEANYDRLKNIENAVTSGAGLTRQLLGFARGGKYEVSAVDLNQVVRDQNRLFGRTRKEISIHGDYAEDLWAVEADRGQIEQVLLNLYINAWQAMPGGGDLFVSTANVTLDEEAAREKGLAPGPYISVRVRDTGQGMDEETKKRAFEPFFTTKERARGTGLGLSSVYGIVKNHGGIVEVESAPGAGAAFTVLLPASEKPVDRRREKREGLVRGTETLLLVDDEETIVNVGREMISALGYSVLEARSGAQAVKLYREHGKGIALVILDMIMPGLSGGETFQALKEENPGVRVLLSSGYSLENQARKLLDKGAAGFIQKPFDIRLLSRRIREILDGNGEEKAKAEG